WPRDGRGARRAGVRARRTRASRAAPVSPWASSARPRPTGPAARGRRRASAKGRRRPPPAVSSVATGRRTVPRYQHLPPPGGPTPSARQELGGVSRRVDALDAHRLRAGELDEALDHGHEAVDRLLVPLARGAGLPALDHLRELAGVGERVQALVEDRLPERVVG